MKKPQHVAEVWLDWGIGRGSTMYRSSACSLRLASLKMKLAALVLNLVLPTFYWGPSRTGRPVRYKHDFTICFGARQLAAIELKDGVKTVWTVSMPGSRGFAGEPAHAHPWTKETSAAPSCQG
jgi:hypothetical protein